MSLGNALSNAVSGLAASSRSVEVISDNLSNIHTPGFARREMEVSARSSGGGVRIDSVGRVVNVALLGQQRKAEATRQDAKVRLNFYQEMERAIGSPSTPGSLTRKLSDFRVSIVDASSQPDNPIKLENVVKSGQGLVDKIRYAANEIEAAWRNANSKFRSSINQLNGDLENTVKINKKISLLSRQGKDITALEDERQKIIGRINDLVPIREVPRGTGSVALFTENGQALIDGTVPTALAYNPSQDINALPGTISPLIVNGTEISKSEMKLFEGGVLNAQFQVINQFVPEMRNQIDSFATELRGLFSLAGGGTDTGASQAGFFTSDEGASGLVEIAGMALRIKLNPRLNPSEGGLLWRVRDGVNAETEMAAGNTTVLNDLAARFSRQNDPIPGSAFLTKAGIDGRAAKIESRVATERVRHEEDYAMKGRESEILSLRLDEDGVNSDSEIEKLIAMNQAYAANARVVQTINDMMDQILRW